MVNPSLWGKPVHGGLGGLLSSSTVSGSSRELGRVERHSLNLHDTYD